MLSHSVKVQFAIPRTEVRQALLPMGFLRQDYWRSCHFPPFTELPNPGIKPTS